MTEQEKQVLAGLCRIEIKRWKAAAESNPNMRYMVDLMNVALASLTEESDWIKCSERMPASHEPVYIFHPHYGVDQGVWYDEQEDSFFWDSDTSRFRSIETVSHWMEIPELPKPPEE